jgi:D-3-phosphoglycerate dehydrogenase
MNLITTHTSPRLPESMKKTLPHVILNVSFSSPWLMPEEPKNIKVLLLENVHSSGVALFQELGFSIEMCSTSLDEMQLKEKIRHVHILGIRSKTQVVKSIFEHAPHLLAIGCFCIGTNQVDLLEAEARGVSRYSKTKKDRETKRMLPY